MENFTTFDGRIGRKTFWISVIILGVAGLVLGLVLGFILGGLGAGPVWLAGLVLYLALLYPALAIGIKRLHDRNKAAVPWAIIFFGPGILLQIMQIFGIGFSETVVAGQAFMTPDALGGTVSAITAIVGIWALVELGFLKGTSGPNAYGPDPLQQ